jgi:cytochrome c-type biogenesis protein CcmH/NrfG
MAKAKQPAESRPTWTQAYVMAVFCLVLGVMLGYLFRGSAPPTTTATVPSAPTTPPAQVNAGIPSLLGSSPMTQSGTGPQSKSALDAAAVPMVEALKKNANDFDTLAKLGNLYYDGQAYPEAIQYYEKALKVRPDTVEVRTDMGTAYWYSGNADRALAEFAQSLKLRPGHAQTLFNVGIVRWQGKNDVSGAVAAWEELLQKNPGYPERDKVQQMMAQAKGGR